jgi:hypothetical protein
MLHRPKISAASEPGAKCSDLNYRDVVMERRLRDSLFQGLLSGEIYINDPKKLIEERI